MSERLSILENSLVKKKASFDAKLQSHIDCVRQANGQPLNDKRNGHVTLAKWEKQNDALRAINVSIKKTERAIEIEESKIANVASFDIPECLKEFLAAGKIQQWRKHPRFFFVQGVDKARIVVTENGAIAHRYLKEIPSQEQYAIFRDVFNSIRRIERMAAPTPEGAQL